ncbi:MAG TPA: zf-HC2 domain-containing protein [Myxococcaceae bacterium]|nr:zf-HC2 domain-containing protein [Myxococcaceae bacterium]
MSACQDYEELLTLHAAGALESAEEALVRAHLESCAACRSEAQATASLLGQVALPALSSAEKQKLEALPQRVTGAWRKEQVRKALRTRAVGALMATAAVLLLMVAPSILRHEDPRLVPSPPAAPSAAATDSAEDAEDSEDSEDWETEAEFEQWASADPLSAMVAPAEYLDDDESLNESWEEDEQELPTSELFLNTNPGELP